MRARSLLLTALPLHWGAIACLFFVVGFAFWQGGGRPQPADGLLALALVHVSAVPLGPEDAADPQR